MSPGVKFESDQAGFHREARRKVLGIATLGLSADRLQELAEDAPEPLDTPEERTATEQGLVARTLVLIQAEFEPSTWQAFSQAITVVLRAEPAVI